MVGATRPIDRGTLGALVCVVALIGAMVVLAQTVPRSVEGAGTLYFCEWGWPVIALGDEWDAAFPGENDPSFLPVMTWPNGMQYDNATGELDGAAFQAGDQVIVKGSVRNIAGDIPPCFSNWGIDIDTIEGG